MKRSDGRLLKSPDSFFKMIPHLMPRRTDSQTETTLSIGLDKTERFLKEHKKSGSKYSAMGIMIAAFIRTVCEYPDLNRFIVNRKIYGRSDVSVSFVMLKGYENGQPQETCIKVFFERTDTLPQVQKKLDAAIEANKNSNTGNDADKIVETIMNLPLLSGPIIKLLKWLDMHNFMPASLIKDDPFHASLFIANLASINLPHAYHHLYEYGTISYFITMGKKVHEMNSEGVICSYLPIGVVNDERTAPGSTNARAFKQIARYMANPELLEQPPTEVREDVP